MKKRYFPKNVIHYSRLIHKYETEKWNALNRYGETARTNEIFILLNKRLEKLYRWRLIKTTKELAALLKN